MLAQTCRSRCAVGLFLIVGCAAVGDARAASLEEPSARNLVSALVDYRARVIDGFRPHFSEALVDKITNGSGLTERLTVEHKLTMASLFMRGAILTIAPQRKTIVAQYYNPYCDISVIAKLMYSNAVNTYEVDDMFIVDGDSLAILLKNRETYIGPSKLNIFQRTTRRSEEFASLFNDISSYSTIRRRTQELDDQRQMSLRFYALAAGISALTKIERDGIQEIFNVAKIAGTDWPSKSHLLMTNPPIAFDTSVDLPNWPPAMRDNLNVVFAFGDINKRTIYAVADGMPGVAIKLELSVEDDSLDIRSIYFIDVTNGARVFTP